MKQTRCSVSVGRGRMGASQCIRAAKVTREGRAFCAQHDPERVAVERAARNHISRLDSNVRLAAHAVRVAETLATSVVLNHHTDAALIEQAHTALVDAIANRDVARRALAEAGGEPSSFTRRVGALL